VSRSFSFQRSHAENRARSSLPESTVRQNLPHSGTNTDNSLAALPAPSALFPRRFLWKPPKILRSDGVKFQSRFVVIRNADRAPIEKSAKDSRNQIHTTSAAPNVKTHPLATLASASFTIAEYPETTAGFRISHGGTKVPYTYVADTWPARKPESREKKFDVIILPPMVVAALRA